MEFIQYRYKVEAGFHKNLQQKLLIYPEKTIHEDGLVTINEVNNPYFYINNRWNLDFLGEIKQFKEMVSTYDGTSKNISFQFINPTVNLEVKYVYFHRLFNDYWSIMSTFMHQNGLNRMTEFLNKRYPQLSSLLEIDINQVEKEYTFWLESQGIQTYLKRKGTLEKFYTEKTPVVKFMRQIHSAFIQIIDNREEWEKDSWDIRILHNKYGVHYNKTKSDNYINFSRIDERVREQVKRYYKQRFLSNNNFSLSTALNYLFYLSRFFAFIFSIEPTWKDIKFLKRSHIEKYIEHLREYTTNTSRQNSNPENHIMRSLVTLQRFLEDIQRYEYKMAPEYHVNLLIFPEDKPKIRKKSVNQIDYIPDYVLEQLFTHIDDLHKDVIPVVWITFKTGLRISEVLSLTNDCLVQLNGQYSIETDIEKTYVKGHRIPIDEQIAAILSILIQQSKKNSNQDNNPEGFIFIRYHGRRKGKPFQQNFIGNQLNILAKQKNIIDENGNLFHFKTHQFRHTYGVKMLNGGTDIITVQELLAHSTPEMTLRYAKLLDDTKRKAFETIISQGVFSFDLNGKVHEIKADEDVPVDILNALWQDHKLNAMDNPYGTCHARLNGRCPHMEAPPCLTCGDNQTPCKDLAVGFSELDEQKYELHVKTTTKAIEVAKQRGRDDIAKKNEKNLQRYQNILSVIQKGNIIFGRQDRIKRKQGVKSV